MVDHDASIARSSPAADIPSKKRTSRNTPRGHARRKYAKRATLGARANLAEGIDIAHSEVPLPSEHRHVRSRGPTLLLDSDEEADVYEMSQETVVSYDPHVEAMLPGDLTLDNLPRPSPPFTVRVKPKPVKREKHVVLDDDDWDVVSNASEESFYMV